MAHYTRIGGTNYEITGGKTRIGGTNYSISGGRTRVGGTNYDISFKRNIQITITGTGDWSNCYAIINGIRYTSSANIEIVPGTNIQFYLRGDTLGSSYITLNRVVVAEDRFGRGVSYTYTPTVDTRIDLGYTKLPNVTIAGIDITDA